MDSKRKIKVDNNAKVYAIMYVCQNLMKITTQEKDNLAISRMGFRQERNNKCKGFTMQTCPIRRGPRLAYIFLRLAYILLRPLSFTPCTRDLFSTLISPICPFPIRHNLLFASLQLHPHPPMAPGAHILRPSRSLLLRLRLHHRSFSSHVRLHAAYFPHWNLHSPRCVASVRLDRSCLACLLRHIRHPHAYRRQQNED